MISIYDMNLAEFKTKEGDIKVDSQDMRSLFDLLENYHTILLNSLEQLTPDQEQQLQTGLALVERMQNKYIVMGDLRLQQKRWYDVLQKIDSRKLQGMENLTEDEITSLRKEVLGFYIEAKQKREELKRELEDARPGRE